LVRSGNYLSSGYFHKLGMTAGSTGAVSSTPSTVGTTPWQTVALSVAAAATAPTTDQLIVNSAAVTRAAFI
jgi:hypothetical protein